MKQFNEDFRPKIKYPGIPEGDYIHFMHPDEEFLVSEDVDKCWRILGYCNGFNSIDDIAAKSGIKKEIVIKKLKAFLTLDVVYDTSVGNGGPDQLPIRTFLIDLTSDIYYELLNDEKHEIGPVDVEAVKNIINMESYPPGVREIVIFAIDKRLPHNRDNALVEIGKRAVEIELHSRVVGRRHITKRITLMAARTFQSEFKQSPKVEPIVAVINAAVKMSEKMTGETLLLDKVRNLLPDAMAGVMSFGGKATFYGAYSQYGECNQMVAGATSSSSEMALFKAYMEAYERKISELPHDVITSNAANLNAKYVDPRKITPLDDEQINKMNLSKFSEDLEIDWVEGYTTQDEKIYVPVDLVYYGRHRSSNKIYIGNSSGVAAHSDYESARKSALVELIERDALMRCWYSRQSPPMIPEDILTTHAKNRKRYWQRVNRHVHYLSLPSKLGTVVLVVIESSQYPSFVSGAAATIDGELSKCINKALEEAEYNLLLNMDNAEKPIIEDVTKVRTPMQHAGYYFNPAKRKELGWLWSSKKEARKFVAKEYETLLDELDIVTIDMTPKDAEINVVKVLSPYLVPISFGYYQGIYLHSALKVVHPESKKTIHFFS